MTPEGSVRLIIRDNHREISGVVDGLEEYAIGALSDEPETIDELAKAMERFVAPDERGFFHSFSEGGAGAAESNIAAGLELVVVDLAARLVVCSPEAWEEPTHHGALEYMDGDVETSIPISFLLSDDWQFTTPDSDWRDRAEERRRERAANPPLDARAVLYGEPLLEFIARQCLEHFAGRPLPVGDDDAQAEYEIGRQIHVRWLMTARDDLRGRTPREVMRARCKYVDTSLEHRQMQWSRAGKCPPPLDTGSAAYVFGGFGTHEFVVYYDLVRALIRECRLAVGNLEAAPGDAPDLQARFVESQRTRLAAGLEEWLDMPDAEFPSTTPRTIIDNERARIPWVGSGEDAVVDHDCPVCQMLAESSGPGFWHLDGCNMDDDFAFSTLHDTHQEWERDKREFEEGFKRWNEEYERKQKAERCNGTSERVGPGGPLRG